MNNFQEKCNYAILNAIRDFLPENVNPAVFLMEVLHIERSAAYRRLRGEICFTLGEASIIAKRLELSLDLIIGADDLEKITFFRMCITEFETPNETDYKLLEDHVNLVRLAELDPSSRLMISVNSLPQQIFLQYKNLLQFYLLKWMYQDERKQTIAYRNIKVPDRIYQIFKNSFKAHIQFKETHYVLDNYIFLHLINELEYFYSIGLIDNDDKKAILEDTYRVLNYLENICETGKYENGNNANIYVSSLNFNKSCYTLKIFNHYISIIEACVFNGLGANDKKNFEIVNGWIQSRCKMSTNITCCGEQQRIEFFNKQRQLLDSSYNQ
ncbi:hypothetical protein JGH11_18460 [Dysgonomonas sp. Marseille-P4677]|uniref:hypothetical protein n=1 Tax=Dysgonomonas sp. Marseille-P4677 TaxID=2364790 RepID=UPI001914C8CD|nr:hypothetical protein [Dysgonomonas sp. Marseille-P4677]MBK5722857.1 hypothetical protein [Dysgonomonas sp. Marseille-P4677]